MEWANKQIVDRHKTEKCLVNKRGILEDSWILDRKMQGTELSTHDYHQPYYHCFQQRSYLIQLFNFFLKLSEEPIDSNIGERNDVIRVSICMGKKIE